MDKLGRSEERYRTLFEQAAFQLHSFVEDDPTISCPKYLISYARGDRQHQRWVEQLAEDLRSMPPPS